MASFLATVVGLAFTLLVCLLVLRALLDPWLRVRRPSVGLADKFAKQQITPPLQKRGGAPLHTA